MTHLTIRKQVCDRFWSKPPEITTIDLTAASEDELFAKYFRDYENRLKYCNDIQVQIVEPDMAQKFRAWIGNVNNYANNGGDMY